MNDVILLRECAREGVDPEAMQRVIEALLRAGHDRLVYPDLDFEIKAAEERGADDAEQKGVERAEEAAKEAHEQRRRDALVAFRGYDNSFEAARGCILEALEILARKPSESHADEYLSEEDDDGLATLLSFTRGAIDMLATEIVYRARKRA